MSANFNHSSYLQTGWFFTQILFKCLSICILFQLDELLKQRESVLSSFSSFSALKRSMSSGSMKLMNKERILRDATLPKEDSPSSDREKSHKKKWFTFKAQKKVSD
jgi:hypothetical protein